MLAHCARATERARYAGAANVLRPAEGWEGDHTDGRGFVDGVAGAGGTVEGSRALLAGAGGAGSAIAYEFLARGAAELAIHDLDRDRRARLVGLLAGRFPGRVSAGTDDPAGFDIVGNAMPMGMRPDDPAPVRLDRLAVNMLVAQQNGYPQFTGSESPTFTAKGQSCATSAFNRRPRAAALRGKSPVGAGPSGRKGAPRRSAA